VLEEEKGDASPPFPPIARGWPRDELREAEPPIKAASGLWWLRAGGSFRGYRFSVWIAAGLQARDDDMELARRSAASVAVSGCWRDASDDCGDS
jgi:hypothetical protein